MRRVLVWSIFLATFLVVQVQAHNGMKIKGWKPLPYVAEPPYIILEVEYPHTLEKPREAITVNGRPATYKVAGYGSSPAGQTRDYYVYVGGPGPKQVTVTLTGAGQSLSASTQVDFRSRGDIIPLERLPGEGVFSPEEWQYYLYFLKDIRIRVNGADQPYRLTPLPASAEHQMLVFRPSLKAGRNAIEVTGKNSQGEERAARLQIYFIQDRTMKLGDDFWFPYGEVGSRSGPFYRLLVEGRSIKPLQENFLRRMTLADNAWLSAVDLFSKELKAVEPGEAVLKVLEKRWFREPDYQLKVSYPLRVAP